MSRVRWLNKQLMIILIDDNQVGKKQLVWATWPSQLTFERNGHRWNLVLWIIQLDVWWVFTSRQIRMISEVSWLTRLNRISWRWWRRWIITRAARYTTTTATAVTTRSEEAFRGWLTVDWRLNFSWISEKCNYSRVKYKQTGWTSVCVWVEFSCSQHSKRGAVGHTRDGVVLKKIRRRRRGTESCLRRMNFTTFAALGCSNCRM